MIKSHETTQVTISSQGDDVIREAVANSVKTINLKPNLEKGIPQFCDHAAI
jgi:hypothetical protein